MATFGVKHKTSGLFFGGFNKDQSVKWVAEEKAEVMDKSGATMQALLLARFGETAQKKPVQFN